MENATKINELKTKIEELKAKQIEKKELSPEELENVAGGIVGFQIIVDLAIDQDLAEWGDTVREMMYSFKYDMNYDYQMAVNATRNSFQMDGVTLLNIETFMTEDAYGNL